MHVHDYLVKILKETFNGDCIHKILSNLCMVAIKIMPQEDISTSDMSQGCSQGFFLYWDKSKGFTTQGIPISQTIRRYPLDTFREMVPNVEDTQKGQDQDAWPRPRHLGKIKTSNKIKTNSKTKSSGKTKITWYNIASSQDHGDIAMSFSVVNFKLIKINPNQLEYLFLLVYLQLCFNYFRLRSQFYTCEYIFSRRAMHLSGQLYAWYTVSCVLAQPHLTDFFFRLDDGHHWQDDLHHFFDFVCSKTQNIVCSLVDMVQERGHMLAQSFSCTTTGKAETHNHKMAQSGVTFALPFCWNQPIQGMSEFDTSLVRQGNLTTGSNGGTVWGSQNLYLIILVLLQQHFVECSGLSKVWFSVACFDLSQPW